MHFHLISGLLWFLLLALGLTHPDADDHLKVSPSRITCVGAWSNCTTIHGELFCKVRYAVNPFQSTVCHMQNACVYKNEIELYDDSPQSKAFDMEELSLFPLQGELQKGKRGNVRLRVYPAKDMPSNHSNMFSAIAGVMIENSDNHNIGHFYGDEIWPVFQMLHRFGFNWEKIPFRLVLRKPIDIRKQQVYDLVSDHSPDHMQFSERRCYNSLFAGSNAMSYSESSPDPNALKAFRDFLRYRANRAWGVSGEVSEDGYSTRTKPNILMVAKDSSHAQHPTVIANFDEAIQSIQRIFPDLKVQVVKSFYLMKQHEQVKAVLDSDIMFTQPGSDAMNAIFLPAGSSLVTPCRLLDKTSLYSPPSSTVQHKAPEETVIEYGNDVRIWFQAMPDMRCLQVCGSEDIKFDTSKYMTPARLNITNLEKTMRVAVLDWQLQNSARKANGW